MWRPALARVTRAPRRVAPRPGHRDYSRTSARNASGSGAGGSTMRANLRCNAAVNELSAAAGAPPHRAERLGELLGARLAHGDVVGPHLDQRGDGELRAHHPPHERRGRPPRHERQHDEVVPLPQVRALMGEHGPHLVDVEAVQHARGDDQPGAQAGQAVGDRDGVFEHAGARRGGPRRGEQVEQLAVPGADPQRADRDGGEHAEQPGGQRRGEEQRDGRAARPARAAARPRARRAPSRRRAAARPAGRARRSVRRRAARGHRRARWPARAAALRPGRGRATGPWPGGGSPVRRAPRRTRAGRARPAPWRVGRLGQSRRSRRAARSSSGMEPRKRASAAPRSGVASSASRISSATWSARLAVAR